MAVQDAQQHEINHGQRLANQITNPRCSMVDRTVTPAYADSLQIPRFFVLMSIFVHTNRSRLWSSELLKTDWPTYQRKPLYSLIENMAGNVEYSGPMLTLLHHDILMAILEAVVDRKEPLSDPISFSLSQLFSMMRIPRNGRRSQILEAAISHLGQAEFHIHSGPLLDGLTFLWNNRNNADILDRETRDFIKQNLQMMDRVRPGDSIAFRLTESGSIYNDEGHYTIELSPWMIILFLRDMRVRVSNHYYWRHQAPLTPRIMEIVNSFGHTFYDWNMETWSKLLLSPSLQYTISQDPALKPYLSKADMAAKSTSNRDRVITNELYESLYDSLREAEEFCEILPGWSMEFEPKPHRARGGIRAFKTRNIVRPPAALRTLCLKSGIRLGSIQHRLTLLIYFIGYYWFGEHSSMQDLCVLTNLDPNPQQEIDFDERRSSIFRQWSKWRVIVDRNVDAHVDPKHSGHCKWFAKKGLPTSPVESIDSIALTLMTHPDVAETPEQFPPVGNDQDALAAWREWIERTIDALQNVGVLPPEVMVWPVANHAANDKFSRHTHVITGHIDFIQRTMQMDSRGRITGNASFKVVEKNPSSSGEEQH